MNNFKKKISIVIPVYNEEKNISILYKRLTKTLHNINEYSYEIIFVNDGSHDNSWIAIKNLAQQNKFIKAINFNKNFGHQIALTAGYHAASGDAIISLDGDLQHPPEIIPKMLLAWQQGYNIVYVQNMQRTDNFLKKITAWGFYKFLGMITDVKMPRNVADFRLIDKKVMAFINQSNEKSRYLRGMVAWSGFKHTNIPCTFDKRISGTTGYTWAKMLKLAFDGITGFSKIPFKLIAYIGLFIITSGLFLVGRLIFLSFVNNFAISLLSLIPIIVFIMMGIELIFIYLLGEYISAIYEYSRDRPAYIISEKINCT